METTYALLESSSLKRGALSGRTALVTGAGRGIGLRTAEALAWLGARVVIAEIDPLTGAEAARSICERNASDHAASFILADIGDENSVVSLVSAGGPFDIVVNNATVTPFGAVAEASLEAWDLSYRVNLRGPVALARLTVPGMIERGYGVFVCLSSVGGAYMGPYETLKAAGNELAATLAAELEGTGVFAFAIGPGQVMTPGLAAGVRQLAPFYRLTEAEFLALNSAQRISAEEAGVGIAAAIALAERFHGTETSSIAGLTAAGLGRMQAEGEHGAAEPVAVRDGQAAAALARQVRATFLGQIEGWRVRGLFERKWMERDFRRHAGLSPDEAVEELNALVAALDAEAVPDVGVLGRLSGYYDRYEQLARDNTRDGAALATALTAIDAWRAEIRRLEGQLS
jgi:NAD(P)-dependent dehydrogenase (short-subunit alcohol dehydrogenase family)